MACFSVFESLLLREKCKSLRMERSFRLGKAVNSESITANYQNGVLSIMLPKKEELNLKRLIEVK
jgi:HSP20 family protein